MDDGEHVREGVVLIEVRGDARVAGGKAFGEGVLGHGERGVGKVEAHELHQVEGEGLLYLDGHVRMCKGGIRLLAALANLVHERNHGIFDLGTEGVEGRGGKAALVLIEPDVIRVGIGVHERCLVLEGIDDAVDVGLEARPVVGDLCFVPDGLCLAGETRPGLGFFGGYGQRLALVSCEDACLGASSTLPDSMVSSRSLTFLTEESLVSSLWYSLASVPIASVRAAAPFSGAMVAPSNSAIFIR